MTKTIYLCGPIKDVATSEANEWRQKAKKRLEIESNRKEALKSIRVIPSRFICLDPMRRQFSDKDMLGVNEIILMDLKDVEEADILLVNYNVARGGTTLCGTSMEIFHASYNLGKYIVAFTDLPPDLMSPWMVRFCTRILPSLDDAIAYIKKHF